MTTTPKRWPQYLNAGLNVVCDKDPAKRTRLWVQVHNQHNVFDKLRSLQEDEDAVEAILRVQAKTCFKGPAKNERAALKNIAKAKPKAKSKSTVTHSYHGDAFCKASVLEYECFQYEDGTPAERNWYADDLGQIPGYWHLGKAAAVRFMKQVYKTCDDHDVQ